MTSIEQTLTCPVCLDLFDDPRLLPCSHTFCCKCLHSTIKHPSKYTCPLCRYEFAGHYLPINRIVLALVEQIRENQLLYIQAKCYECKSYEKLDVCFHCDTLLCTKCHHRHEIEWKNRDYRTKNLLLSKVTWLKFQINFKQRHEKPSRLLDKLHSIEHKLHHHHQQKPINRQQFQDNKHQLQIIADDLQQIDTQLQDKFKQHVDIQSPICITQIGRAHV